MEKRAILTALKFAAAAALLSAATSASAQGFAHGLQSWADGWARGAAIAGDAQDARLKQELRDQLRADRAERDAAKRIASANDVMALWSKYASRPTTDIGTRMLPDADAPAQVSVSLDSLWVAPDAKTIRVFMVTDLPPGLVNRLQASSVLEYPSIDCVKQTVTVFGMTFFVEPSAQGKPSNQSSRVVALTAPFTEPFMMELLNRSCHRFMLVEYTVMLETTMDDLAANGIDVSSANQENHDEFDRVVREGGKLAAEQGLKDVPTDLQASSAALRYAELFMIARDQRRKNQRQAN